MTASAWRLSQRDRIVSDTDGYSGAAGPHRICPLQAARIVAGVVGIARHFQTGQQIDIAREAADRRRGNAVPFVGIGKLLCLSEIKHVHTNDGVRREMA